jgi:hypothetical protein
MSDGTPAPAAPPSAASELFGTDLPAPATLSGFLNPGSGNYKDETGSLRYHRSSDQLAADHRAWMVGFDNARRAAACQRGSEPILTGEARRA